MKNNIQRNVRSGFTLIELLVVIAIIAILAAILFPVFAQARDKARAASCLSNEKQWSLAFLQYAQDFDETWPLGQSFRGPAGSETWRSASVIPVPNDWRGDLVPGYLAGNAAVWSSSLYTYIKSYGVYTCPSGVELPFAGGGLNTEYAAAATAGKTLINASYTYNGLLHQLPVADVRQPADCPLLWEGNGQGAGKGYTISNPTLDCRANTSRTDCVYKPYIPAPGKSGTCGGPGGDTDTTGGNSIMFNKNYTGWVHSKGTNWVYADGHAKWRRVGAQLAPADTNPLVDPETQYDAKGFSTSYWAAPVNGGQCHASLFRPDWDHVTDDITP